MASSVQASNVIPAPTANPTRAPPLTFGQRLAWFGGKVLDIAERVGEGVVSFLGLDESHFQEVLDNMTEEEMAAAVEVNNRRTEEYRQAGILPLQTELPPDLTPEDVAVEVFSSSTKKYTMVNGGMIVETDIENAENGMEMQPTMSMTRSDIEVGSTQSTASPSPSPASFARVSTTEDTTPAKCETSEAAPTQREDAGLMESGDLNI